MKFALSGIVLIVAGIWVKAHYTAAAQLCASPIGGFAQMFSSSAQQDCTQIRTAVALAPWAIGAGVVIVVISLLFVLGVLGTAVASRPKRKSGIS
jgi:hypothetical protein